MVISKSDHNVREKGTFVDVSLFEIKFSPNMVPKSLKNLEKRLMGLFLLKLIQSSPNTIWDRSSAGKDLQCL